MLLMYLPIVTFDLEIKNSVVWISVLVLVKSVVVSAYII